ncbi:MAG: 8-amino-7-oxononanoate synthase, partial [Bacteroidota bacterium]
QLYLNMLYDIVRVGIENHMQEICMSRTALEIKSSVGAEPYDLYSYVRFSNSVVNKFSKSIFNYLDTEEDWVQRKPFKA